METEVVNIKSSKYDVFIGRPSKWGNPFFVGYDGTRDQVIQMYRNWITKGLGNHLIHDLHELKGKRLGCFCFPQACHGDILIELVSQLPE